MPPNPQVSETMYRLSAELHGHTLDVRGVGVGPEACLLSASRDNTAKLWHPQGVRDFANVQTYKGHSNFVSSVCFLNPCQSYPEGLVVTASNDKTINCYNIHDSLPTLTLKGHENVVCLVTPGNAPGTFLSASWDSTGRLWSVENPDKPALILKGHEAVVWAVLQLGNGTIATASADKFIFIWTEEGKKINSLKGHSDCVRGLAIASPETFLSCANDASIKLWTNKGECINTFFGHSNYIYSVCANPFAGPDCFVSCGEDSTVRVWSAGDNVCTISLPAQSVWCVACLSNGDIVAGSSDGIVRVFTKDAMRVADEAILQYFEETVAKHLEASTQEIGGYKVTDLPGPETLLDPGRSDGQTKLVRFGTKVKCYSWSGATNQWNEIGEVTGSAKPAEGKSAHEGKEYDYVFNVDIEDGKPPLKLPYNMTEDPWAAAQTFIHKNFLPQAYLEQVANFIITNSKQNVASVQGEFADPFTGGTRYVPGSNGGTNQFTGVNADPFTGSSSYSTSASSAPNTGAPAKGPSATYFPQKTYLRFDQANVSAILDKIIEFNKKMDDKFLQLPENNIQTLMRLAEQNSQINYEVIESINVMLLWPKNLLFPVLDALRLMIRNKDVNAYLFKKDNDDSVVVRILLDNLSPDSPPANQMLSLRVLCNAFIHLEGEMAVLKEYENILNLLICLQDLNKNAQIATATLMLNLSVALGQSDPIFLCQCLTQVLGKLTDHEALFRGLVALGTLLTTAPTKTSITSIIVSHSEIVEKLKMYDAITNSADQNELKVVKCCRQIAQFL